MKTVMIVSHPNDLHASYVIDKAKNFGIKSVLLDTGLYPRDSEISISLFGGTKKLVFSKMI